MLKSILTFTSIASTIHEVTSFRTRCYATGFFLWIINLENHSRFTFHTEVLASTYLAFFYAAFNTFQIGFISLTIKPDGARFHTEFLIF